MNYQDKLYTEIKNIVIKKCSCDENSELLKELKKHIYAAYENVITDDKMYNFFLKREVKYWTEKTKEDIENYFFPNIPDMVFQILSRHI